MYILCIGAQLSHHHSTLNVEYYVLQAEVGLRILRGNEVRFAKGCGPRVPNLCAVDQD